MTAYGEALSQSSACDSRVVIQSINRRYLEISVNLPSVLAVYESEVRKWVSSFISRGQVNVTISMKSYDETVKMVPNLAFAKEIKKGWDQIARELGISCDFPLSLLAQEKDLFLREESEKSNAFIILQEIVNKALVNHSKMREEEGDVLRQDIQERLLQIKHYLNLIDSLKQEAVHANREKMKKKITELFEGDVEERVIREVALFAEKVDISEELVRFQALFYEFGETLSRSIEQESTKGKKLEFLLQELSREINTIGSKSLNVEIAKLVVNVKSELEKIREQVQNIE